MTFARPWSALALCLTACASPPQLTVPESLLAPCPAPVVDVRTVGGLAQGLLKYDAALKSCNDDKSAIRSHLAGNGTN